MSQEKRSKSIYRKIIPIGDYDDYAIDIFDGDLPPLSEGDSYVLKDRAGLYNIAIVKKEDHDPTRKCDKDHHYCRRHKRCERDDHDCDDNQPHDIDKQILEAIQDVKRILSDTEDVDIDRKILNVTLSLTNTCNTILSILQNVPPPPPSPIPPPPPPTPSPPPPLMSTTRVIIQGEVDVPIPELNEEDKPANREQQDIVAKMTVEEMKKRNPSFKITRVLVARGNGPVGTVW